MRIEVRPVIEAFDSALQLIQDTDERDRFQHVLEASSDSVRSAVHDIISQAVNEVNEAADGAVRVSLGYGADGLDLTVDTPTPEETADDQGALHITFDDSEVERLTLRLPAELKEMAAQHADSSGVSLNTWLTRLVSHEAGRRERGERRRGRRGRGSRQSMKGWIGG